jgi:phosphoglycerol transferase MdoB-like AlkP superfamily enzyme
MTGRLALPIGQIAIGIWLVAASRWWTGTGVSLSGALDDAAFVLLLAALQCSLVPRARGALAKTAAALPLAVVALFVLANQMHFAFFKTNLGLASFQIGDQAVAARTSVAELLGGSNFAALFALPVIAQAALLRFCGERPGTKVAAPLAFVGLLAAGVAGVLRHDVFIFPDNNPAMSLAREVATRAQETVLGSPRLELERTADALFNRDGYIGYEFAGDPERPLYQRAIAPSTEAGAPINVVLILMESVRAFEMQGSFRDLPVMPVLNALEAESLVFPNFYYNGMRTVDAEYSILCSGLPLVSEAPVYVSRPKLDIRCLPEILSELGYQTHWISAYRSSYGGKAPFLRGHGVREIHDEKSMDKSRAKHADIGWGMSDVDMYEQAVEKLNRFREPFFAEIMTLSNHHPFDHEYGIDFPDTFADVPGTQHYRNYLRGVHYTDHAIGRFLEDARGEPWFDRTLFVIVGDHSVRAYPQRADGTSFGPVLETEIYFRGRLILYAPGLIEPDVNQRLGSQIDVAPTLMDLLQVRADNSFLGVSLLAPVPDERRFALTNIGHVWNIRVGNQYCYSVGYSCFVGVFPRCAKGAKPTFAGHTCFESERDLITLDNASGARPLEAVEREKILARAKQILDVNRTLVREDRFR